MSIAAISWAKSQKTGSPTAKLVLLAIAGYADDDGLSWPSQAALMEDTELSERAVRNALALLEGAGFLTRAIRRRADQTRRSDEIRLNMRRQPASDAGSETNRHHVPEQPAFGAGINRHVVPNQPARRAPLTTFEPSLNHQGYAEKRAGSANDDALAEALSAAAGPGLGNPASAPALLMLSEPRNWIENGCSLEADVLPVIRALTAKPRAGPIRSWSFFRSAVFEARDTRLRPPPEPCHDRPARHQTQSAARASEPRGHGAVLAAAARLKARLGDAEPRREVVSPGDDGGGPTLDLAAARRA